MYCFQLIHINKYHFDLFRRAHGFNYDDLIHNKADAFMQYANDKLTEINTNTGKGIQLLDVHEMDKMINCYKEESSNRFVLYDSDQEIIAIVISKYID